MAFPPSLLARYRKVRRWVDRDLSKGPRRGIVDGKAVMLDEGDRAGACLLGLFLPMIIGSVVDARLFGSAGHWGSLCGLAVGGPWLLFVIWRGTRLMRAMNLRSGRQFERSDRYAFAPEYHEAEDAALAARRRRRG